MSTDITRYRKIGAPALIPALALLMMLGAGCSEKETTPPQETAAPQEAAPAPVEAPEAATAPAEPQVAAEPPATDTPADTQTASAGGEKTYKTYCHVCHAAGIAGAPKLGDKDLWAPRIAKGNDAMFSSVKNGLKTMPPKGTCMGCSDDELRAAMQYMIDQSS
ncbi:MAG: cytochrome c5 family protein [Gammaproteobacteria bacterium]|nr:MAG: cytochrome c5 family protein [Gammaproteobacteria bacterium]